MTFRITNPENLVCGPATPLTEVLTRIEQASPNLFQVIVGDDGRVLGTVTDGDLRRAILRGATLSSPVGECMRTTPILGRVGEGAANRILVRRMWFLPVVTPDERLDHILVDRDSDAPMSRALVMAGGFGKRLGKLTQTTPKPMLPVAGRPMLDRVLEQIESAGVTQIDIAVHYLADQIKDFVAGRLSTAKLSLIEETEPLGTAGALALISDRLDEPVLVANGDVLTQVDLTALHRFHARHNYDGTIAVWRHEVEIPFGVIQQTSDGQFLSIEEKPRISNFVAAGIYYLSPEFAALTPRGRPVDMPEVITNGAKAGLRIGLFPVHEYCKDVGRPGDFAAAQVDHAEATPEKHSRKP